MPPKQAPPPVKPPPSRKGTIIKPREQTKSPVIPPSTSSKLPYPTYDAPSAETHIKIKLQNQKFDVAEYTKILEDRSNTASSPSSSSSPTSTASSFSSKNGKSFTPSSDLSQTTSTGSSVSTNLSSFFRSSRFRRVALRYGGYGVIAVGGLLLLSDHLVQVMWVNGPSMTPCLNEGYGETNLVKDMILVKKWEPTRNLKRGMVVTFPSHLNPSNTTVKRIIALPGDRVTPRHQSGGSAQIVPWNHVWVEGDASDAKKTMDSNTYGPVSMSLISGRVMCVLWPRMRMLRWDDWAREGTGAAAKRLRVEEDAVKIEKPYIGA
ncbi:mitochondrial inner membrane protease subunit Imp2 [Histoplasma capsulatum H143]|uniref:Mitochondrial inner membrane protease subunit 2 n=1 Tax=Ajellomyces capsulatus (strain H143) TaxID=544712 RepID=C6HN25_AJECH|nr:mitochondrial inner membrane protease subunit Imp2 [Histoplasma capsulatum H143]